MRSEMSPWDDKNNLILLITSMFVPKMSTPTYNHIISTKQFGVNPNIRGIYFKITNFLFEIYFRPNRFVFP